MSAERQGDLDVHTYQEDGKWHFEILQLPQGSVGASNEGFLSKVENRGGYKSEEEAKSAALQKKQNM